MKKIDVRGYVLVMREGNWSWGKLIYVSRENPRNDVETLNDAFVFKTASDARSVKRGLQRNRRFSPKPVPAWWQP